MKQTERLIEIISRLSGNSHREEAFHIIKINRERDARLEKVLKSFVTKVESLAYAPEFEDMGPDVIEAREILGS